MARKAKRSWITRVRWGPIIWLLVALVVGISLEHAPMMSLSKVRVVGARPADEAEIRDILAEVGGIPFHLVNGKRIEEKIEALPEVDSAHFRCNILTRGLLTIRYRVPIASLVGGKLALDGSGAIYPVRSIPSGLVAVRVPRRAFAENLAVMRPLAMTGLIELVRKLPDAWPEFDGEAQLDANGGLCLNRKTSKIVLGEGVNLSAKLLKLKELRKARSNLLNSRSAVILISPDHPTSRQLSQDTHETTQ